MTATEKHRETAKDIAFDFDCDWTADGRRRGEAEYRAAIEAIAAALAKAEREGMEAERARCADLLAAVTGVFRRCEIENDWTALIETLSTAILSEAEKDE